MVQFSDDTLEARMSGKKHDTGAPVKEGTVRVIDDSIPEEEWLRRMEQELAKTHHHADGSPVHLRVEKGEMVKRLSEAGKDDYKPDQAPVRALCECGKPFDLERKDGYSSEKAGYSKKEDHRPGYDSKAGYSA
jgi:hypothetical protein